MDNIQWPDGIDTQRFLSEFWQKKPLLIRQAFPDFQTPLPADELAGLSLEPDTTVRLITQDAAGAYHLEHGPFDDERFATLTDNNWSLLVTDVEKHIPDFIEYLQPFRFISDWRIDDLMISYAPDGASVGAHIDEYDVFLLQGSGTRTWSINADINAIHTMRKDGDLKILDNFTASHTWDLVPGDMLYLPPHMAHHGVARGDDCTTWSIGFRAPRKADLVAELAERIADAMPAQRYTDTNMSVSSHGRIEPSSIDRFRRIWDEAVQLSDDDFAQLLGQWLTESNHSSEYGNQGPGDTAKSAQAVLATAYTKAPFSRFAFIERQDGNTCLFVDGVAYDCSNEFAQALCAAVGTFAVETCHLELEADKLCLNALIKAGVLLNE